MGFGKLLKIKLDEKGISQAELAKKANIPKTTLSGMISRDISKIEIEVFLNICKALDCDPEDFYNDYLKQKQKPLPPSFIEKYNSIDDYGKRMVDTVLELEYDRCTAPTDSTETIAAATIEIRRSLLPASAGTGDFLEEENTEIRSYPDTPEARQADIVIPVDGQSMEPMFHDGDELYVRLQPAVEIGEIGIFMKGEKAYVKKYAEDRLISINPDFDDIYPDDAEPIICRGKVIGKAIFE